MNPRRGSAELDGTVAGATGPIPVGEGDRQWWTEE
jgi:hypothetical protein